MCSSVSIFRGLFALLLIVGCGRTRLPVPSPADAGVDTRLEDVRVPDVPVPDVAEDAPPAPPLCPAGGAQYPAIGACALTATSALFSDRPNGVDLMVDQCACDEEIVCGDPQISPATPLRSGEIRYRLEACGRTDCEECEDPVTPARIRSLRCSAPALPEGIYQVIVNGQGVASLQSAPFEVRDPANPVCVHEEPGCTGGLLLPEVEGEICVQDLADVGSHVRIVVRADQSLASCKVFLSPESLLVLASPNPSCEGSTEVTCITPPLPAGNYGVQFNLEGFIEAEVIVRDIGPRTPIERCTPIR